MNHKSKLPQPMWDGGICVDDAMVEAEAAERAYRGRFSRTNEPLSDKADHKNICALRKALDMLNLPWSLIPTSLTKGWDFEVSGVKVKVMGAKEGGNLLIKQRKRPSFADVYILCWIVNGNGLVMRWCNRDMVSDAPVVIAKKTGKYTVATHKVDYTAMSRDLYALKVRLGLEYGQAGLLFNQ